MASKSFELAKRVVPFALIAAALGTSACTAASGKNVGPTSSPTAEALIDPAAFVPDIANVIIGMEGGAAKAGIHEQGMLSGDKVMHFTLPDKRSTSFDLTFDDPYVPYSTLVAFDVDTVKAIEPGGNTVTYSLHPQDTKDWTVTSSKDGVEVIDTNGVEKATQHGHAISITTAVSLLQAYEQQTISDLRLDFGIEFPNSGQTVTIDRQTAGLLPQSAGV